MHLPPLVYRSNYWIITTLVVTSIVLHSFFAWHQSFTNDEGAYLYDARTVLRGELPAGDVLTKAPVPVLLFALGELLTGNSLFAARITTIVLSIVTVIPLFFLLRILGNEHTARIGAVFWLLGSGSIVFHTMGHTQAVASFFTVSSAYLFIVGIRSVEIRVNYIFFAGICFALAYASRKTAIALLVPMVLAWIVQRETKGDLIKVIRIFLCGLMSIGIFWMTGIYILYGFSGVSHAVGIKYGEILLQSRSISPWAGSADHMLTEAVRIGSSYVFLLLFVCIAITRERVLIGASWVATLVLLYWVWPTHLVEYLADFIPSLVIAGSLAIASFRFAPWLRHVIVVIFMCITFASLCSVYVQPWTGMFTRSALVESAAWLREHVPTNQKIFTAAVIIPYLSGHNVPFHLSHPQWYVYDFISDQDKYTFLPPQSVVEAISKQHDLLILRDQLFDYVYPNIELSAVDPLVEILSDTTFRQNMFRMYLRQ